jgi:hypothetical protein
MARIRNALLPAELNEQLVQTINRLPDSYVVEMGRKCLPGGFTHAHPIRTRIAEMLRGDKPIPPWLLLVLRENAPGVQIMRVLSFEGLASLVEAFILLKGRDSVALPLLLDARDKVHHLGAEVLARKQHVPLKADAAAATRVLCQFIDAYLLCMADTAITPPAGQSPVLPEKPEPDTYDPQEVVQLLGALGDRVKEQEAANRSLQQSLQEQAEKHREQIAKALQPVTDANKRIRAERDEARQRLREVTDEKEMLAARWQELNTTLAAQIALGVAQQTSALIRKWLAAPLAEERQLGELSPRTTNLLARAEQALEAQARQDRAAGNRLELERQLAQLRQTRERLATAAQVAIRPLPALQAVLAEVQEELRCAEGALANHSADDLLTDKLLVSINRAATWGEAQQRSELVQQLVDAELVPERDRRRLYDALQRKFSLLMETCEPAEADIADHGWSLREVIYRDRPALLLLDGHNLLFRLEDIFRPCYEADGHPGRQARERLVEIARSLLAGRSNLRVRICFDAPQYEAVVLSPNLAIEYSGGQGEHRADARIGAQLAWRRPDELGQKWYVVTDDRAVRRQAVKDGARYVPADLFAVLLADFQCLGRKATAV